MSFEFSEAHVADYMSQGYTVLQAIVPPALLKDLRAVTDKGRQMAREKRGPQAQRIQHVKEYDLDQRAFKDYVELPLLVEAVQKIIGPQAWLGDQLGVLFEPANAPWCTSWHRDISAVTPGVDAEEFEVVRYQRAYFNQVNCALYDDSSTWYVPASHCRDDLSSEVQHADIGLTHNNWEGLPDPGVTYEEQEVRCLNYCRNMPRAVCLHLGAGDFGLYRPTGWHLGNYVPYRIRATLHDTVWTPENRAWYDRWYERRGRPEA